MYLSSNSVNLSKPFTICHRERMGTHSNHLSNLSVNTLRVCITNVSNEHTIFTFLKRQQVQRFCMLCRSCCLLCFTFTFELSVYLSAWSTDAAPTSSHHITIFTHKHHVSSINVWCNCSSNRQEIDWKYQLPILLKWPNIDQYNYQYHYRITLC